MAPPIPFLGRQKVRIAVNLTEFVELDATLSESHTFDTQITDHPVEEGANITDHIRVLPIKLHLSGVVSNTPLTLTQINLDPTRATDALGALVDWQSKGKLLDITTKLTTYQNMMLKTVVVNRNKETGNVVAMELDFQEIRVIVSATASVEPRTDKVAAKPKKTKGKVQPKVVEKKASLLTKLTGVGA